MIIPSKHLDLDRSALRISAEVLVELKRRRVLSYDRVVSLIKKRALDDGDIVVVPALSLLFLLGRMEYHPKSDVFEYIEPDRA
jgi:hypothetical protein